MFLISALFIFHLVPAISCQADSNTTYLTATAIVTKDNASVFECWQLTEPFRKSSAPGVQTAAISNSTNFGYAILPPRHYEEAHNEPAPQLVHLLSGLVHITLPQDDSVDAWILGGVGGIIIGVDTTGSGHIAHYASDQETVAITAPFAEGKIPEHVVLDDGPCVGRQTFI